MRILFVCAHQVWPPETGARLRNFHLAHALAKRHTVTLAQLRPAGEQVTSSNEFCKFERVLTFEKDRSYTPGKIIQGLLGPNPLPVVNYYSSKVAESIRQLLATENFDAVQLEGVHLLPYAELINRLTPPAVLVDWHNIESELMRRYADTEANWAKRMVALRTANLLEDAESRLLRVSRVHTVPSERERQVLLSRGVQNEIYVLPNGVDVARFSGVVRDTRSLSNTLLFVGSMDYHANIDGVSWFVREIWPEIQRSFPDFKLTVAGRNPAPEIQRLASGTVRVTGTVPDVLPYYQGALAVVVPLRVGGGTRLKILEAMAAGVPVISTHMGAEGLDVRDGADILLADSVTEFKAALKKLITDEELRARLTHNGRTLVSEKYDWDSLGQMLSLIHERQLAVI